MLRGTVAFGWAHLRGRAGRSVALLAGVLVATTGFTVLTGTTATARLQVTGTVDANARAAYDILVRPKGTRTPLEAEQGLVRPNYLSGLFGGITMEQYERVRVVAGVDVAAPISMIGYANAGFSDDFDITDLVDRTADRQIIRIDPTFTADRGLSKAPGKPMYVYVTKGPVTWPDWSKERVGDNRCGGDLPQAFEADVPICNGMAFASIGDLATDREQTSMDVVRLRPDGTFERGGWPVSDVSSRLTVSIQTHVPFLLAAVDPAAEDRLVGLRGAVDSGRYLTADDRFTKKQFGFELPVLCSSRGYVDSGTSVAFSRLQSNPPMGAVPPPDLRDALNATPTRPLDTRSTDGEAAFHKMLDLIRSWGEGGPAEMRHLEQIGPVEYDRAPDGTLVARTVPANPEAYRTPNLHGLLVPWQIDDTAFRTVVSVTNRSYDFDHTGLVGTFDPQKLTGFSELSKVPMETYEPPGAAGADQRTRDLLGGRPLRPDGNAGGYLSAPPLLLTTLANVPDLLRSTGSPMAAAPVSAIRVRVADVHGFTKDSRERVRLVAERIATETGLDVDITYGSSAAPQTVELAAGKYGRPTLRLTEGWSKKGVAAAIVNAVDRKSAVLFILVLVVCALFLGNAVSAAVRDRRSELAILSCLGWPARRIGLAILTEVLGIGAVAGLLGLALSAPLGALLGVRITTGHALLAVPVALGLTLLAGAVPAIRASRAHPAAALHPLAARAHRTRRPRTVLGLGLVNLTRVPARTLLGAAALALGVAALTLVAAVTFAFRGAVVGTVLGDAVSLRVRGVDTIAVAATVLLGALAVADVLYLNIRDRATEFATLRATGWGEGALGRLVTYEGLGIGLLGGLLGAAAGLGGAAWFVGAVPPSLVVTAALTAAVGVVVAGIAALVPAVLLRRLPIAQLLAEE